MKVGDRVEIKKIKDVNGDTIYGTVLDTNFLGFSVLVKCETQPDYRYIAPGSLEVPFLPENLEVLS